MCEGHGCSCFGLRKICIGSWHETSMVQPQPGWASAREYYVNIPNMGFNNMGWLRLNLTEAGPKKFPSLFEATGTEDIMPPGCSTHRCLTPYEGVAH